MTNPILSTLARTRFLGLAGVGLSLVLATACATSEAPDGDEQVDAMAKGEHDHDGHGMHATDEMHPAMNKDAMAGKDGMAKEGTAMAVLKNADGLEMGTVMFTAMNGGTQMTGSLKGLAPSSMHGFHVHEGTDCGAGGFEAAGGHFNPMGMEHGGPEAAEHHAGDLGNVEADDKGVAKVEGMSKMLTLSGKASVVGHAVILHEGKDDLKSQPSGDAGRRIACGIVQTNMAKGMNGDAMMKKDDAMMKKNDAMMKKNDAPIDGGDTEIEEGAL